MNRLNYSLGFQAAKNPPTNSEDMRDRGSIPGSGRSPGGGNDYSLQYSCLETPMDRGAWRATVHRVAELDTTEATEHVHTHTHTHTHNYSSGTSSVFTLLYKQHHHPSLGLSHLPKLKLCTWQTTPESPLRSRPSVCLWVWLIEALRVSGIRRCLSFCVLPIPFRIMSSRFTHVAGCVRIAFFLKAE